MSLYNVKNSYNFVDIDTIQNIVYIIYVSIQLMNILSISLYFKITYYLLNKI